MSNTKDGVPEEGDAGGGRGRGATRRATATGPESGPGAEPPAERAHPAARRLPPRAQATLDREAVLRATAAVLDERGYEKTTIRTISKHLGCAVGSIYRHFTDKNQLLDEVVQGRFTTIVEAAEAGHTPDAVTRAFVATAAGRPEQYRLMFWLSALGRGADEPASVPAVIRRLVDAWGEDGQLGSVDAARSHWGRLHGELMLGHHDGKGVDADAASAALGRDPVAAG